MSEVERLETVEPLHELVARLSPADHILTVKGPLTSSSFLRHVFPKETHFRTDERRQEDAYEEFVSDYEVASVIRSDQFKVGDHFWAWEEPAYSLEDVRRYHEEGFSRSPVVLVRKPVFPLTRDRHIVVVSRLAGKSSAEFPVVYSVLATEGLGAEAEIRKLLKRRPGLRKPWWRPW